MIKPLQFFLDQIWLPMLAGFAYTVLLLATTSSSWADNPNQLQVPERAADKNTKQIATADNQFGNTVVGEFRTIDGANNNARNPAWGRADIRFTRLAVADYANTNNDLAGSNRANPRSISNVVHQAVANAPRGAAVSDMFWQWGQFLDHDLTLTPEVDPEQRVDIAIPKGDPWFDPNNRGAQSMHFARSTFSLNSQGLREQHNFITAYIDASHVYGSDTARAAELRTNDGTGRLKTSAGNLLPLNQNGFANAPNNSNRFFLAGDFRANEQVGLTAMHTLFVREHNRLVQTLKQGNSNLSGEQLYQRARALVGALMQEITYKEFLPKLLGKDALDVYRGYNATVNASISNEFATAAFRVGHTMLSSQLLRIDSAGAAAAEGHLRLKDAFFAPQELHLHGIDSILRGLSNQRAQKIDIQLVDDVRNMLFGAPGAGGLDLAALNIQRGRDHGLASYNATRAALGLTPASGFSDICRDTAVASKLAQVYDNVDDIDLWVGGLAEDLKPGAMIGGTFYSILTDQFRRLRDGDRFWYERHLSSADVQWVKQQTLAQVIRRNSNIGSEIRDDVFAMPPLAPVGAIMLLLSE